MLWSGVMHSWPVGMGAGAFELGFSRWQTEQLGVTFTHPENMVLQAVANWGLPLSVISGVALLILGVGAWKHLRRRVVERTVFLGLLGVLLHEVFDFALELQAVAATCAVLLGLLLGADGEVSPRWRPPWWSHLIPASLAVLSAAFMVFGLPPHRRAENHLASAMGEARPVEEVKALAVQLIGRHPADWVLYAHVASDFARRADPRESLAWINRLLFLRPADARAHVAAAQSLLRLHLPLQALGEFNQAWALGETSSLDVALVVAEKEGAFERLLIERPGHLTMLWERYRQRGQPASAKALLDAVELSGMGEGVRDEAAALQFRHELEVGDGAVAAELWNALPVRVQQQFSQQLLYLSLLERLGRKEEALHWAEKLVLRAPQQLELTLKLVDIRAELGRVREAREAVERARPFFSQANERSRLFQKEAALLLAEGRWGRALDALETASRLEPQRADLHYRRAEVLEKMGSLHAALDAIRAGRVLDTPAGAQAQQSHVARLEAELMGPGP